MKTFNKILIAAACAFMATGFTANAQFVKQDWGDFKLWIDPGHSGRENAGLYNYTEAEKVLRVGLATREFLFKYTTATEDNIQMTRDDDQDNVSLDERSDMANAWGADFFYSIHSDAGSGANTTVTLFGGWKLNGQYIEKTPNGGKRYGDILCPNLTSVMYQTGTRGNYYDRVFYNGDVETHTNQYPYLSVNRRTNMASLLSEGGYHTHPVQQGLNMNDSYKHLEAFGTFRSIMEYRGLERPDQVMLAGVVTNSENGQGIDNCTVTVNGETVVTDSFESLFKKYVKNDGTVHNGFFLFEDLEPGQEYTITYSAPGFTPASKTVTMQSDPQGLSGDNVTWGNIELTSELPATVSNNVYNPDAVNQREDIVFTFSRKMDKASVEQAFSINLNGQVTLSWDNDYTLRVNISQLIDDMTYTITIKDTAKNSQTNQALDGNNDGVAGGDYVFTFTTIPADVEAPYVANTSPRENETQLYTQRPVIRIEFNEELDWNEDEGIDAITMVDSDGNTYDGRLTHTVIRNASVLHLYLNEDLPLDKCFKVTVKDGFKDLAGNVGTGKTFKFLSEYRTVKTDVDLTGGYTTSDWYTPGGSGSSKGFTSMEEQTLTQNTFVPYSNYPFSYKVTYKYDPDTSDPWWGFRIYCKTGDANYPTRPSAIAAHVNAVLVTQAYGDGSDQHFGYGVRWSTEGGTVKLYHCEPTDRGWMTVALPVTQVDCDKILSGSETRITDGKWSFESFTLWKYNVEDAEDEIFDNPESYWAGEVFFCPIHELTFNNETQTASLDDIADDEPNVLLGDVNNDGEINALDVTALITRILNGSPAVFNEKNADLTGDGEYNAMDVTALISLILSN